MAISMAHDGGLHAHDFESGFRRSEAAGDELITAPDVIYGRKAFYRRAQFLTRLAITYESCPTRMQKMSDCRNRENIIPMLDEVRATYRHFKTGMAYYLAE